ncbi:MAG: TonB-dependent receptor [Bacteroidota bacterium]|nr:TonB-dependent receptor [Bacteroidota bacterium]
MRRFLFCIFSLFSIYGYSQVGGFGGGGPIGYGKISGFIIDSITQKPLAYANVVVREALEDKELDGVLSEENGGFRFKELKNMKYEIVISYLGYESKIIGPFKVNKDNPDHQLGKILISESISELDAVTVVGQKDLIENKIDRMVYNAERDITSKGGNAADVLRRTPMLTVDLEGNVSLRGSTNIRMLINGKPSSIMSSSVADALKMIPADVIQKVEVITQPGAKYDADGTAGIINIVTKTKKMNGVSGSINASAGTRSNFLGSNISLRTGKIGFTGNLGGHLWRGVSESYTTRENFTGPINSALTQTGTGKNIGGGMFAQIGADYDIDDKNSLTGSVRFPFHLFSNKNTLLTEQGIQPQPLLFDFERESEVLNRNIGSDLSVDYRRTFDKDSDREFSISSQYSFNNRTSDYSTDQFDVNHLLNYSEKGPNLSDNKELTFAADYLHPISKKVNFEIGLKSILRNVISDIYYDTLQIASGAYLRDQSRNNYLDYDQNVASAYSQLTFPIIKDLTARAGLRYEQTFIKGNLQEGNGFKNEYRNWFPSGLISYQLKDKSTLKLSYTRRISRPSMFYLNPYINYNDPTNISYGNPELDPELTESFELGYNWNKDIKNINISVYHKITNDLIDNYRFVDSIGRTNATYNNLATNYSSGVSINGGIMKLGKIILNSTFNLYYQKLVSEQLEGLKNDAFSFSMHMFGNVNVSPVWGITVFSFFNSPKLTTQGKQATWFAYNIGVRRDLWKKKGGVSLGIDNPFHKRMKLKTEFRSSEFSYNSTNDFEGWGLRASIDYRFGKMEFGNSSKKKRKGSLNDDLKQGESDGGGGGAR